jgi:hypothetical protein
MLELGIGTNPMFQPKDYNELCMEYKTFRRDSLIREKNENADAMLKYNREKFPKDLLAEKRNLYEKYKKPRDNVIKKSFGGSSVEIERACIPNTFIGPEARQLFKRNPFPRPILKIKNSIHTNTNNTDASDLEIGTYNVIKMMIRSPCRQDDPHQSKNFKLALRTSEQKSKTKEIPRIAIEAPKISYYFAPTTAGNKRKLARKKTSSNKISLGNLLTNSLSKTKSKLFGANTTMVEGFRINSITGTNQNVDNTTTNDEISEQMILNNGVRHGSVDTSRQTQVNTDNNQEPPK